MRLASRKNETSLSSHAREKKCLASVLPALSSTLLVMVFKEADELGLVAQVCLQVCLDLGDSYYYYYYFVLYYYY